MSSVKATRTWASSPVAERTSKPVFETTKQRTRPAVGTYERLLKVDVHYTRLGNQLFPLLESKGFDKPSKVMWTLHDDIRKAIKGCRKLAMDNAS